MKKIWIVDDDPGILEVTKIVVEEAGYLVKTYTNAETFFEEVFVDQPDLILLDIFLSGVDGIEVCKKIKQNPQTKHIPVIIMSADPKIAEKHAQAGADDFITKPFDIVELQGRVGKYTST